MLTAGGIELCYNDSSRERLRQMRALYEPHAETLSRFHALQVAQRQLANCSAPNRSPRFCRSTRRRPPPIQPSLRTASHDHPHDF